MTFCLSFTYVKRMTFVDFPSTENTSKSAIPLMMKKQRNRSGFLKLCMPLSSWLTKATAGDESIFKIHSSFFPLLLDMPEFICISMDNGFGFSVDAYGDDSSD